MDLSLEASRIYKETLSQEKEERRTIRLCHSVLAAPLSTNIKQTNGGGGCSACVLKETREDYQPR